MYNNTLTNQHVNITAVSTSNIQVNTRIKQLTEIQRGVGSVIKQLTEIQGGVVSDKTVNRDTGRCGQ